MPAMPPETDESDFLSLLRDTTEFVKYFKELGIDGTEPAAERVASAASSRTIDDASKRIAAAHSVHLCSKTLNCSSL
jgi:hypothetical protein